MTLQPGQRYTRNGHTVEILPLPLNSFTCYALNGRHGQMSTEDLAYLLDGWTLDAPAVVPPRPTIAELEAILASTEPHEVYTLPDGQVRARVAQPPQAAGEGSPGDPSWQSPEEVRFYEKAEEGPTEACDSCGHDDTGGDCPHSKKPCKHHCNCIWTQDKCCWCGKEFGEEAAGEGTDYLADETGNQLRLVHRHVKEALELLGVDVSVENGYVPDSWTLREQCYIAKGKLDARAIEIDRLTAREQELWRERDEARDELAATHAWLTHDYPEIPADLPLVERVKKLDTLIERQERDVVAGEIDRLTKERDAAREVLRSLACWLSVGGYNADTVDPAVFERKIRDGVDAIVRVETQRAQGPRIAKAPEDAIEALCDSLGRTRGMPTSDFIRHVVHRMNIAETAKAPARLTVEEVFKAVRDARIVGAGHSSGEITDLLTPLLNAALDAKGGGGTYGDATGTFADKSGTFNQGDPMPDLPTIRELDDRLKALVDDETRETVALANAVEKLKKRVTALEAAL